MSLVGENGLELVDVAGRIDRFGLVGKWPNIVYVRLSPTRVDHDTVGAASAQAIELGKHAVIEQLAPGEHKTLTYEASIVVARHLPCHNLEHVRADGRIMGVAADGHVGHVAEQRIGECVAGGLEVDIGQEFDECLDGQQHRAQTLTEQREQRVVLVEDEEAQAQMDELGAVWIQLNGEALASLLQEFTLRSHLVACVHHTDAIRIAATR